MISKTLGTIIGIGACATGAALLINPSLYPASVAATGAALGGASVATELRRKQEDRAVESARVAVAFSGLYELNKGLVSPQQLSIMAGVPVNEIEVFLKHLSEQQQGKFIETPKGGVYNFPHPNNVLEQLTDNAQAWVKSQTDPLLQEIANLKLALNQLNDYIRLQKSQVPQTSLNNSEEQTDPWSKLL
jgi:hypothetical protein